MMHPPVPLRVLANINVFCRLEHLLDESERLYPEPSTVLWVIDDPVILTEK